jgi:hypothetical protein
MELKDLMKETGLSESELRRRLKDLLGAAKPTAKRQRAKAYTAPQLHSEVKVYKGADITRQYTCLLCGSVRITPTHIEEGEDLAIINANGKVERITIHSPATVECFQRWCQRCDEYIANMSVEELRARYRALARKEAGLL